MPPIISNLVDMFSPKKKSEYDDVIEEQIKRLGLDPKIQAQRIAEKEAEMERFEQEQKRFEQEQKRLKGERNYYDKFNQAEQTFNEHVEHEWKLCKSHRWFNNFKETPRNFDDFKRKIKNDPSYKSTLIKYSPLDENGNTTETPFDDNDYKELYKKCSANSKEEFSKIIRESPTGQFILNGSRTGGKRKTKRNKTRKNKRKSKTYKKSRK